MLVVRRGECLRPSGRHLPARACFQARRACASVGAANREGERAVHRAPKQWEGAHEAGGAHVHMCAEVNRSRRLQRRRKTATCASQARGGRRRRHRGGVEAKQGGGAACVACAATATAVVTATPDLTVCCEKPRGCGDAAAGFEVEVGRDEAAVVIANAAARDGRTAPRGLRSPIGVTLPDKDARGCSTTTRPSASHSSATHALALRVSAGAAACRSVDTSFRSSSTPFPSHWQLGPGSPGTAAGGGASGGAIAGGCAVGGGAGGRVGRAGDRKVVATADAPGFGTDAARRPRRGAGGSIEDSRDGRGRAEVRTAHRSRRGRRGRHRRSHHLGQVRTNQRPQFLALESDAAVPTGRGRLWVWCSCAAPPRRSSRPTATASCSAVWTYSRSRGRTLLRRGGEEAVDGPNIPSSDSGAQASGFF